MAAITAKGRNGVRFARITHLFMAKKTAFLRENGRSLQLIFFIHKDANQKNADQDDNQFSLHILKKNAAAVSIAYKKEKAMAA